MGGKPFAEGVKHDIETLVSIDTGGAKNVVDITAAMISISTGLLAFSLGTTAMSIGTIAKTLAEKVEGSDKTLAELVKEDIETLMSINIPAGVNVPDIRNSMVNLGVGLAAFGTGTSIAAIGKVVEGLAGKVAGLPEGTTLAEQIVKDMEALMSIQLPEGGMPVVKDVSSSMRNIALGMAALGVGEGVAGLGKIVGGLATKVAGVPEGTSLAQAIVADMEALMNIKIPEGGMKQVGDVEQSMKNMAKGMMAFGTGEAVASLGAIVGGLAQKVTGSNKTVAESMADDMAALLAIQLPTGGMTKVDDIEQSMKNMAKGMAAFGAGIGIASIGDIVETLAKKVGDSDKTIAESIKEDVELLTSINVTPMQSSTFEQSMKDISAGLVVFTKGKTLSLIVDAFGKMIGSQRWTEAIKDDIDNLMSIMLSLIHI